MPTLLAFYFRVEEKIAVGKFREIPCAVDIYFAGGKFRAKSKFANLEDGSPGSGVCIGLSKVIFVREASVE